jgi:hypothetical protein
MPRYHVLKACAYIDGHEVVRLQPDQVVELPASTAQLLPVVEADEGNIVISPPSAQLGSQ